jgi:glycine betaine/choline ABC-type transport system substrate-binding protein
MTRKFAAAVSGSFFLLAAVSPGFACVGRVLNLTVSDSAEQQIIAQVMATYINQRTGTTVNVTTAPASKDGACSGDVCIQYVGDGLVGMKGQQPGDDQEAYKLVKEFYMEKEKAVWLKPFGYKGPVGKDKASQAVPVAKRDSLAKFPVLDRVINKLGGLIDDAAVQQLIEKAKGGDAKAAAKEFLKAKNLI